MKVHALVTALTAVTLLASNPPWTLWIGGLLCGPTFIYLALREARQAPLRLNPLAFYLLWHSVGLGFSALYIGSRLQAREWVGFAVAEVPPEHIATGYVLFMIGSLAFHAGLQLVRPRPGQEAYAPTRVIRLEWLILLWGLGLLSLWKNEWFKIAGMPAQPLHWAGPAAIVAVALVPWRVYRLTLLSWLTLIGVGTVGLLTANLMSGSKAYIMFSFLPLGWMLLFRPGLRRWLIPFGVVLAGVYFLAVAPAVSQSRREPLRPGETTASRVAHSFQLSAVFQDVGQNVADRVEQFLNRQFEPIATAFLVGEVERDGYRNGETMSYASYAFIPRLVWPDKPLVVRGGWFYAYAGGAFRESESGTSLGITAVGELYWNFGLPGVLLGMLTIGLLYGLLWRMAGNFPITDPLRMLLFVCATVGSVSMSEAVSTYAALVAQLLIFGTVFLLRAKRPPSTIVLRPTLSKSDLRGSTR